MNGTAVTCNRLAALAVEIEAAHLAVRGAFRTTLERAAYCGRLLIEVKALVGHGNWLPWIEQNTTVGPREVQRYMRVAARWTEIEANASTVTHLTLTEAVALLAEPKDEEPEPGSWEWAEAQLEGPFNAFDFADNKLRWLTTKLLHKAAVPPMTAMALGMGEEYDLPLLRAVPGDALAEALRLMAGIVKGDAGPAMDVQGTDLLEAWVTLKMTAQRIFALLWDEVERREKRDDDTLEREAKVVLARLEKILQQRQATLDELKQRHAPGELSDDKYGDALIALAA